MVLYSLEDVTVLLSPIQKIHGRPTFGSLWHLAQQALTWERSSDLLVSLKSQYPPLPVLPRIRPRLSRGTLRVTHNGMPRQTLTSTRAIGDTRGDRPSQ